LVSSRHCLCAVTNQLIGEKSRPQRSVIARHFLAVCAAPVRAVRHGAIDRADLFDGIDRAISFARHPLFGREDYGPANTDPDLRLAERIASPGID
jgi:hypothetical protein